VHCRTASASHLPLLQGKKHQQRERQQRLGAEDAPRRPPPLPLPRLEGHACQLCRKQFTSQAQLEEHVGGKWHAMRLRGELPASRKG